VQDTYPTYHIAPSHLGGYPVLQASRRHASFFLGTRHESHAEDRTDDMDKASPRSLEIQYVKGTALRFTPFGSTVSTPLKEARRADSKIMDRAQFKKNRLVSLKPSELGFHPGWGQSALATGQGRRAHSTIPCCSLYTSQEKLARDRYR
jgi:hypothetical protein